MKNIGWVDLFSNVLWVCYDGLKMYCVIFIYNCNMFLLELFNN